MLRKGLATVLIGLLGSTFYSYPLLADSHFESVTKDEAFRAQLNLSKGAAFVALEHGYTYYRTANIEDCETPDVLVHGFSVPSYIWDPTFDFLASKGRCVVMLDLYGRGFSDNPDVEYTDELFAHQVIGLLDHLGLEKASLFGLSNGGRVVSQVAGLAPHRTERLIYVASSGFGVARRAENTRVTKTEIGKLIAQYPDLPAGQLSDFKDPSQFQDWDDKYAELLAHKGFARALISTRKNHDSTELDRIHAMLEDSDIPVVTIWGDSDTVVVYERFAKKIAQLLPKRVEHFVPNSGHLPHMENRIAFEAILEKSLGL
ncbi:alpha/beta fold hydrolase [Luminiphilus sp.]|jgi:pimeloyl-ACP methyl ester carboxylesterase|nr:alpha/beta fold hydrolase [Luminiphilus sp.]